VIREVSRPELRPQGGNGLASIGDDAPSLHWPIFGNGVQEVRVVDSLVTGNELFFGGVLNVTEVLPALEFECFVLSESCKGFILLDLLKRCELKGSLRHS
jgi:hypothetical protein